MKNKGNLIIVLIVLLVLLVFLDVMFFLIYIYKPSAVVPSSSSSNPSFARVSEVIDGETVKIGTGETVKLIGIDVPQGDYYDEAKFVLSLLALNQTVKLERDQDDKDSSGNLLRYIFLNKTNFAFVNEELVKIGYALPVYVAPNGKYRRILENAHQECLKAKLKLCS